jgi:hypothetical protein
VAAVVLFLVLGMATIFTLGLLSVQRFQEEALRARQAEMEAREAMVAARQAEIRAREMNAQAGKQALERPPEKANPRDRNGK